MNKPDNVKLKSSVSDAGKLEEALDDITWPIYLSVAAGFETEEEIKTMVLEALGDDYDADDLSLRAERLINEEIQAHLREQATWPDQTDCDRLDAAFAELERAGIVARQNFTCCTSCGAAEIWNEVEAVSKGGHPVRGYTFYHMQTTEKALDGLGVFLVHGAIQEGDAAAEEIAREIVATIQRHGLAAQWAGSCRKTIHVPLVWKRRR